MDPELTLKEVSMTSETHYESNFYEDFTWILFDRDKKIEEHGGRLLKFLEDASVGSILIVNDSGSSPTPERPTSLEIALFHLFSALQFMQTGGGRALKGVCDRIEEKIEEDEKKVKQKKIEDEGMTGRKDIEKKTVGPEKARNDEILFRGPITSPEWQYTLENQQDDHFILLPACFKQQGNSPNQDGFLLEKLASLLAINADPDGDIRKSVASYRPESYFRELIATLPARETVVVLLHGLEWYDNGKDIEKTFRFLQQIGAELARTYKDDGGRQRAKLKREEVRSVSEELTKLVAKRGKNELEKERLKQEIKELRKKIRALKKAIWAGSCNEKGANLQVLVTGPGASKVIDSIEKEKGGVVVDVYEIRD